jgi:UDP-N-acetylmuramoyl-tripeptide--D-alanyl-D-alanine ligase
VVADLDTIGCESEDGVRVLEYQETANGIVGRIKIDNGEYPIRLPMSGAHNLHNACLALAVGHRCQVSPHIALEALSTVQPPPLRGEIKQLPSGGEVVLDCYNANPQSMRAAVSTFVQRHPDGVLALGDMLELGAHADAAHAALGVYVADVASNTDLIGVGHLSRHMVDAARRAGLAMEKTHWCADAMDAAPIVRSRCEDGRGLLLKGSRGMGMERILKTLSPLGRA